MRKTRNPERHPLVFKGLIEYGFRRNLLGLKPFGVSLALAALAGCSWNIFKVWGATGELSQVAVGARSSTSAFW